MSDTLNTPGAPLNQPGDLLGPDSVAQRLESPQRVYDPQPTAAKDGIHSRGAGLKSLPGRYDPADPGARKFADRAIPLVPTRMVVGQVSGVRTAMVNHQHMMDFWVAEGVAGADLNLTKPNPPTVSIDHMEEDMQLFSFMPAGMLPTREEFERMVSPGRHGDVVNAVLHAAGLQGTPTKVVVLDDSTAQTSVSPPPFVERLSALCTHQFVEEDLRGWPY